MGIAAGICWNAPIQDARKNIQRAMDCIEAGHGRVEEYPDVTVEISGYSARCIRELYTHIIGTTRLQDSTRYVNMSNFEYFIPPNFTEEQKMAYEHIMGYIRDGYQDLLDLGVSKEDAANVLPLGMYSKIVLKINLRALEHFANMRMCTRAYKEIRALAHELKNAIAAYSDEWNTTVQAVMVPKCVKDLFCTEQKCCGKAPTKKAVQELLAKSKLKPEN